MSWTDDAGVSVSGGWWSSMMLTTLASSRSAPYMRTASLMTSDTIVVMSQWSARDTASNSTVILYFCAVIPERLRPRVNRYPAYSPRARRQHCRENETADRLAERARSLWRCSRSVAAARRGAHPGGRGPPLPSEHPDLIDLVVVEQPAVELDEKPQPERLIVQDLVFVRVVHDHVGRRSQRRTHVRLRASHVQILVGYEPRVVDRPNAVDRPGLRHPHADAVVLRRLIPVEFHGAVVLPGR